MSINYVSSTSVATAPTCTKNVTTTVTTSVTLSLTAGDILFFALSVGGDNNLSATASFTVADNLGGNTYTVDSWVNSGTQQSGVGLGHCLVSTSGSATITASVPIHNSNAVFDLTANVGFAVMMVSGSASISLINVSSAFVNAGTSTLSATVVNSSSVSVTTSFGSVSQQSCVVADYNLGVDVFVAAKGFSTSSPPSPTVTGASFTYALEEHPNLSTTFPLELYLQTPPITVPTTIVFRKTRSHLGTRTGSRQRTF